MTRKDDRHRVVIVGGGFGGLYAAKRLRRANVDVTLIDRRNFHLFQPLLYQVATGGLSPGDITTALRWVLRRQRNTRVWLGEVTGLDPAVHTVAVDGREVEYDTLVLATGAEHHYFGNDAWVDRAPGLKTIEDATHIRSRVLAAFESAEMEADPEKRARYLTFVIIGAGPTGVELAGAVAELARDTLRRDFRDIDTTRARVLLVEGADRVLPPYPRDLSTKCARSLRRLGVEVRTGALVEEINDDSVAVRLGDNVERISCRTVIWAAGVRATGMGRLAAEATGATLDRMGRVIVEPDLSVPGYGDILVIGDLANCSHQGGQPLPGIAPVAMSQGRYVANAIRAKVMGRSISPYRWSSRYPPEPRRSSCRRGRIHSRQP